MGDITKNADLMALIRELQAANEMKIAEAESRMEAKVEQFGGKLEQLSLKLHEVLTCFNQMKDKRVDVLAPGSNNRERQPQRTENQPLGNGMVVPRYTKLDFPTFDGSEDSIRTDVEMQSPRSLAQAMSLARAFEKKQQLSSSATRGPWQNHVVYKGGDNTSISTSAAKNSFGQGGQTKEFSGTGSKTSPFIKKLSSAELAERRAKGLCYNCDETYSAGHQCKKLFWLEFVDEVDMILDVQAGTKGLQA